MATAKQNTTGTTGSLRVFLSEPGTTQTVKQYDRVHTIHTAKTSKATQASNICFQLKEDNKSF